MPVYEYRCTQCRHKMAVFFRSATAIASPTCERCGSSDVTRLFSTFAVVKSEESRLDDLDDDSALAGLDESDPRAMARWMRRMGGELGEERGPEFDEMVDRLDAGEGMEGLDAEGDGDVGDFDL